ncbi:hypothetical protein AB0M43_37490 [Longispora sp. NPDC051575]|uniref:hypothetical protein n=1 Tax=Longispora sp. NPDC051575 TaxID=3154943 RepID=UPI003420781E
MYSPHDASPAGRVPVNGSAPTARGTGASGWRGGVALAACVAIVLAATAGLVVGTGTAPPAVPVLPAPALDSPWAQAGVTGMTLTNDPSGVRLRVVEAEPMADEVQVERTLRQLAKIAWRRHPAPMPTLAIEATSTEPARTFTVTFTATDLVHRFGPRPDGLDTGKPRPPLTRLEVPPAGRANITAAEAQQVLDELLGITAATPPGNPHQAGNPQLITHDCLGNPTGGVSTTTSTKIVLDQGVQAEAALPAINNLWTERGLHVLDDLDHGQPSTQARVPAPGGGILGGISVHATVNWLTVQVTTSCL